MASNHTQSDSANIPRAVVYGIILFVIAFPMARQGMKFVLDNVDFYLRKKTKMTFEYNWHLLVFGLVYIVFLLGIQAVMLSLVDVSRKKSESDMMKDKLKQFENDKAKLEAEKAKLMKQMNNNRAARNKAERNALEARLREANEDEEKINDLINNIRENADNYNNLMDENNLSELENTGLNEANNAGQKNLERARELISDITISDLESFAKKQGIRV